MKHIILILSVLLFGNSVVDAQLNLEKSQQLARNNYPLIKQFDLIEKSKKMNLANVTKAYLPQLSVTAMAGLLYGLPKISLPMTTTQENNNFQFIGIANLSQMIWDGGITRGQKQIVSANAEVEKQNIEVQLYKLKGRINQLYFGILLINEQMKQVDILNDNLVRNLNRGKIAYKNGTIYQSDLDKINVEIINVKQSRIKLQSQKNTYIQMLSLMIHKKIPEDTSFEIPKKILLPNMDDSIKRPELDLFKEQRSLNKIKQSASKSRYMPKIGLKGYAIGLTPGIKLGNNNMNYLLMGGIAVSWNIAGLYTKKNDKKIMDINNQMISNKEKTFILNINQELIKKKSEIQQLQQLIIKDNEIVQLRTKIKKASETKFKNGVLRMTDLLNDINAENLARHNKTLHQMKYLMSLYQYKIISGNKLKN